MLCVHFTVNDEKGCKQEIQANSGCLFDRMWDEVLWTQVRYLFYHTFL